MIRSMFDFSSITAVPWLRTADMISRAGKLAPLTKYVAKSMSHYRFLERLYHKAQLTPKTMVLICGEPGTTTQCGVCGCVHKVGSGKHYFCRESLGGCGHHSSRDGSAAVKNLHAEALRWNGKRCVSCARHRMLSAGH